MEGLNGEIKEIDEFRKKVLDIMSLTGNPVGKLEVAYNCFTGSVRITVQRSQKVDRKTITIAEDL